MYENKALHLKQFNEKKSEKDVMKNKHPRLMLSTFIFITELQKYTFLLKKNKSKKMEILIFQKRTTRKAKAKCL
jgi:hypothetical protein